MTVNSLLTQTEINAALLMTALVAPWISLLLLWVYPKRSACTEKTLSLIGFLIPALISLWLWSAFNTIGTGDVYQFNSVYDLGLGSWGIFLNIGLNGISMPLFVMATIVGLAAALYATQQVLEHNKEFLSLLLVMEAGLIAMFACRDVFFIYCFHEFALIPSFILMGVWGGKGRRTIAMEMTLYLMAGSLIVLLGLIALYHTLNLSSFDLVAIRTELSNLPPSEALQKNLFGLLLVGLGVLVSLFPFHSWAPRAYATAPASLAMLHAGVLKKFGLYLLIQLVLPIFPVGAHYWAPWLTWLALGNLILIGMVTIAQKDLKSMLGYSSVMHMGYVFLGLVAYTQQGIGAAVMIMFAHGLSVALLWMLADCVESRTGTTDMPLMGGLITKTPVLAGFFVAAILASAGLPGFVNFWGELTLFVALWAYKPWVMLVALAGIILSAIYGLRAVSAIFMGQPSEYMHHRERHHTLTDLSARERLPAILLLTLLIFTGIWPRVFTDRLNEAVVELTTPRVMQVLDESPSSDWAIETEATSSTNP
jgi:NADH-quinone oxidoreductase subunit M